MEQVFPAFFKGFLEDPLLTPLSPLPSFFSFFFPSGKIHQSPLLAYWNFGGRFLLFFIFFLAFFFFSFVQEIIYMILWFDYDHIINFINRPVRFMI